MQRTFITVPVSWTKGLHDPHIPAMLFIVN